MVLNEVVKGAAGIGVVTQGQGLEGHVKGPSSTQEDLRAAVVSIMEEYISLKNWHLITVSEETDRDRQDQQVRKESAGLMVRHQLENLHLWQNQRKS